MDELRYRLDPVDPTRTLADRLLDGESIPWLSLNEIRRILGMPTTNYYVLNGIATNSATTSSLLYNTSNVVSYGDAAWTYPVTVVTPPEVQKAVKARAPKPETEMQWLKRRIAEVSWVPV